MSGAAQLIAATVLLLSLTAAPGASAQGAPYCQPGQSPAFGYGFDQLKARIGPLMGEPVECAHPDLWTGDLIQRTTAGLAARPADADNLGRNITTFTAGRRHWMMTPDGAIYWEGDSPEPPNGRACAWLPDATEPTAWTLLSQEPMWTVIVGSFPTREEANRAAVPLCATGLEGGTLWSSDYQSLNPGWWVAYSGSFRDRADATRHAEQLRALGFDGAYSRWVSR